MTYFNIGSLTILGVWIASLIALMFTALLHRIISGNKMEEWYWNSFFLYLIIWKLSYILFNFKMFLYMPLSIVYFNGGIEGHFLAIAAVSIYLIFVAVKKYPSIYNESAQILFLYFSVYVAVMSLLEKNTLETIIHFIVITGYTLLLLFLKKRKLMFSTGMFIVMMLLEILVISFFHPLFTTQVWTFSLLGITIIIQSKNKEK